MKKKAEIIFFPNGNTAVFIDGQQSGEHQESWISHSIKFLEEKGIDIIKSKFKLPNGDTAQMFKTENGYNRIINPEDNPDQVATVKRLGYL